MTQLFIATASALHALATVVFVGYYLLLSLLYLPVLSKMEMEGRAALGEISRRSRPWLYASILIFILTGIYLMIVDTNYLGIGNFSNPWAILMLVKHVLILGMIVMGFWFNAVKRVGQAMRSSSGDTRAVVRFRGYNNAMAICGVAVLLLTAIAQIE